MRALDIGSGSGYLTACMARLISQGGKVYGMEIDREEAIRSVKNLSKDVLNQKLLQDKMIEIIHRDGKNGLIQKSPFNAIHVGGYLDEYPDILIDQLDDHGRLIVSIHDGKTQKLTMFTKKNNKIEEKVIKEVEFTKIL